MSSQNTAQNQRIATPSSAVDPNTPPWMRILPPQARNTIKDYFVYTATFLPIAPSTSPAQNINITADSDFVILYATRIVTSTDNLTVFSFPPMLALLTDSGSGRQLSSAPIHIEELFGDAQNPAYLPMPKLVRAGSSFTVQLQNLDTVNSYNARVSFHGFKSFGGTVGA